MSGNEVGRVVSKLKRYVPLDYNYENRVLPGTRGLYSSGCVGAAFMLVRV